jgi:CO/xanthine dehydrogenase Mo-binding subunit
MNRIAETLGIDPLELRLKNANRIGDLTANRVRLSDPSTVPVVLAAAERIGYELEPEFRQMTNEPRSGELLPEHLLASVAPDGGAETDGKEA